MTRSSSSTRRSSFRMRRQRLCETHVGERYGRKPKSVRAGAFRPMRAAACDDLICRVATLKASDPPLDLLTHPVTAALVANPSPLDDRSCKHREDLLDAAPAHERRLSGTATVSLLARCLASLPSRVRRRRSSLQPGRNSASSARSAVALTSRRLRTLRTEPSRRGVKRALTFLKATKPEGLHV